MKDDVESKKCLVTGATGAVGVPLVYELLDRGHHVRVLSRRNIREFLFPKSVEVIIGDLHDQVALEKATAGIRWIFHLAAKLHINDPDEKLREEYFQTNVTGTTNLLRFAGHAEKFIFFSTINVYGKGDATTIFDESSPLNPEGFYAESKALAEREVLSALNSRGEKFGVVLRLAAVYGSRVKGNYLRLLRAIKGRRFVFVNRGTNHRTTVHQSDVARAAILAAEKAAGGSIYNVTDCEIHTLREIVEAMCKALDRKTPTLNLPIKPLRVGLGIADSVGKTLGISFPLNSKLLDKLVEDIAVNGEKFCDELDFQAKFDLNKGWLETVNNLASND